MGLGGVDNLDHANESAVYGAITVGTTAIEVKVGASPLVNRKMVTLNPQSSGVFLGYDSGVTTATGTELFKDEYISLPIGPDISVYLIATGANNEVRIAELA